MLLFWLRNLELWAMCCSPKSDFDDGHMHWIFAPSLVMSPALQRPMMAAKLKLPKSCGNVARHTSRNAASSDPDELRGCPTVFGELPSTCPTVAGKFPREPRLWPKLASLLSWTSLVKSWPMSTKHGRAGSHLSELWQTSANFGQYLANSSYQVWQNDAKPCRIRPRPAITRPTSAMLVDIGPHLTKCAQKGPTNGLLGSESRLPGHTSSNCSASLGHTRSALGSLVVALSCLP